MEDHVLIKEIKYLLAENEMLKNKNLELTSELIGINNWLAIKEMEIFPRLRKKRGYRILSDITAAKLIGLMIENYLGLNSLSEINNSNYARAKEMAVYLTEIVCKGKGDISKEMDEFELRYKGGEKGEKCNILSNRKTRNCSKGI